MTVNSAQLEKKERNSAKTPQEYIYIKTIAFAQNKLNEFSSLLYEMISEKEFNAVDNYPPVDIKFKCD